MISTSPPTVKDKTIRRILIFFLVISAVLAGVALATMRNLNRSVATSDWVNHTHATILAIDGVLGSVHAADAALRTFLMSGDARDRVACKEALDNVAENIEVAKALTRDDPQQAAVARLDEAVSARADFTRKLLNLRQENQNESVRTLLANDGGEGIKDIQRIVDGVKTQQMALLAERDTASYQQAQTTRWTVWTGVGLDFVLLIGVAWLIRDDLTARHQLATTLQAANQQLDAKVRERTHELAAANDRLSAENLERRWSNQGLQHQLRYNQLIVSSINDSVLVLTKAMNVSRINPALVHLTGRDSSELINGPLSGVVRSAGGSGNEGSELIEHMARALREGRDLRDQAALVIHRDGRETAVKLTLFPLRDRDKVVGGVVILQQVEATAGSLA